mmetsp:Transcript_64603/g.202313  ORF Transcript_64603/g.202313 Transcript_64603/m.202313 type:complete len:201 (-) Transcript_64603:814-1416(-)
MSPRPRMPRTMCISPQILSTLWPAPRFSMMMPLLRGTRPTSVLLLSSASSLRLTSVMKSTASRIGDESGEGLTLGLIGSSCGVASALRKSPPRRPPNIPRRMMRVKYPFCDCWSHPLSSVLSSQNGRVGCRASRGSGWKNLVPGGSFPTNSLWNVTAFLSWGDLSKTFSPIRSSCRRVKYQIFATLLWARYSSMDANFLT